ncbi:APC family permease [Ammoniphilus sp. YIM 78166]|uniref:APC family permease n=1 Tax=Ammoniphilus sp. YIM 78166 TaxID=1644106 RepID=UPI0010705A8A|nr:APC family permease [Ammoniphilus sp. YIM 78166]
MTEETALKRELSLYQVVLFGLAYLTPMIVFGMYGTLAEASHGAVVPTFVLALVAMLFTAYSYGKMVKAYPIAGSAYTFTRKTFNAHVGFMVGWAILLDYVFIPMVIWLIGALYFGTLFPSVPMWVWIVAFILLTTAVNILGVRVSNKVNFLLMIFQFLVIGIFILLSIRSLLTGTGAATLFSIQPFFNEGTSFHFVLAGAAIACYSFLGFDAITTFTEETKDPVKTMPRAIMLTAFIGGITFIGVSYLAHLVFPDYTQFKDMATAGDELAYMVGGNLFSAIFLAGLIIAQFTSGLSAQASASRLLYAMGRDSVLPKAIFGYISPKYQTPVITLILIGLIGLFAIRFDVLSAASCINFGAFAAFTMVNLSVIVHYYGKNNERSGSGLIFNLIIPLIGAVLNVLLLWSLDPMAKQYGMIWAALGLMYLVYLTKGFKQQPADLKMDEVV